MSEETAPIVVTLKGGRDYDAPWLVIRGNRPDEVANMLNNLGSLPEAVSQAAQMFAGVVSAGPVLPQQQSAPAQQAPAGNGAAWGTIQPGQGFQPAQQAQPWGGGQQQSAPPQQGQPSRQGAQLHPEGEACGCGKVLEYGKTRTNKGQWKCPDYRWNNGNPNDHRLEWAQ